MPEDHIQGLIEAFEGDDQAAGKRHLAGLARQVLNGFERAVTALEEIAAELKAAP